MLPDSPPGELQRLLTGLTEGLLDRDEHAALAAMLRTDPSARAFYHEYMEMHSLLQWHHASPLLGPEVDHSSITIHHSPPLSSLVGYSPQSVLISYLMAAVLVAFGLLIGSFIPVSTPTQIATTSSLPKPRAVEPKTESVGRISGMVDCQWAKAGSGGGGQRLGIGNRQSLIPNPQSLVSLGDRFALASGLLEITYDTGARVILQGPVTYEVDSRSGGYLSVGKLTARVEKGPGAGGQGSEKSTLNPKISNPQSPIRNPSLSTIHNPLFTIKTPTAVVTDLGTEFGVEVLQAGLTRVHVLQGIVEARSAGPGQLDKPRERVMEGHAVEIARAGDKFKVVAFAPQSFVRKVRAPTAETPAETAYIQSVLADQPMGYWPLNEPAGARRFVDRSGHGIHGYAMQEVRAGQPGPMSGSCAIELDGDGYIDLGYHPEFAMKNDFTVEAWAWIGKVKRHGMIFSVFGAGELPMGWTLMAGRATPESPAVLQFGVNRVKDVDFLLPVHKPIEGRWLHVAVVFDRANVANLYLNGEHRGAVAVGGPALVEPAWLAIGCAEQAGPTDSIDAARWRGRIAHVAVYPRALTAQQIQNHYGRRNVVPDAGSNTDRKETP